MDDTKAAFTVSIVASAKTWIGIAVLVNTDIPKWTVHPSTPGSLVENAAQSCELAHIWQNFFALACGSPALRLPHCERFPKRNLSTAYWVMRPEQRSDVGNEASAKQNDLKLIPEQIDRLNRYDNRLTYTYGSAAAHVAVDPGTGDVELLDCLVVEDVGRIVNPLTLHGQAIGGMVQGLGGAFPRAPRL